MRASIALVATVVACAATATEPLVEARLVEAAASAATLQRVLAERQPAGPPPCPEGDCGTDPTTDPNRPGRESETSTREAAPRGGERGGGMAGMHPGGMAGMGGMQEPKVATPADGEQSSPTTATTASTNRTAAEPEEAALETGGADAPSSNQAAPKP